MREILQMLQHYRENPKALSAPDIPKGVLAFLEPGLAEAVRVDDRLSDPLLAYGSDVTYRCKNAQGKSMTIVLWGNTDGWGMLEG